MAANKQSARRLTFIMCFAEVLSMTGFAAYTTLLPQLQREWGMSNSEAGAISGILFAGYMMSVPVLTSLTDRMDSRRIYLVACLTGALGAAIFAWFGQGFWTAALAQFLIGAGLGGTYMPGLKALTDHLEGAAQSRATAFYTASFGLGSTLSILVAGKLGARSGEIGALRRMAFDDALDPPLRCERQQQDGGQCYEPNCQDRTPMMWRMTGGRLPPMREPLPVISSIA